MNDWGLIVAMTFGLVALATYDWWSGWLWCLGICIAVLSLKLIKEIRSFRNE